MKQCLTAVFFLLFVSLSAQSLAQVDSSRIESTRNRIQKDQKRADKLARKAEKQERKQKRHARKMERKERKRQRTLENLDRNERKLENLKNDSTRTGGVAVAYPFSPANRSKTELYLDTNLPTQFYKAS
jgi:septal ring factor EnvC (AmiA/AmiB activator)